jgi:hypothetical protein
MVSIVSSFITSNLKNTTGRSLMTCYCSIHQENLHEKSPEMTSVATMVSKLINFIESEGIKRRQIKDYFSDMDSEYGDALYYNGLQ